MSWNSALDLGALRAGAHDISRGAIAEQQVHRVDDDRLARAGFAGEHVEARRKGQIEPIDDGQVADTKFSQHRLHTSGRKGPSRQGSCTRLARIRRSNNQNCAFRTVGTTKTMAKAKASVTLAPNTMAAVEFHRWATAPANMAPTGVLPKKKSV